MKDDIPNRGRFFSQIALVAIIVLFMANLSALIDHFQHPEIPYFDNEHLLIGGITALLSAFFIGGVVFYMKRLENVLKERKRSEEKIQNERDRSQQYLDVAGVMLVAIDTEGKVTLMNRKGCEILEYCEEDIIGKNWFDNFVPERLRIAVKSVFQKLMVGEIEVVKYYENPVLTKNGKERLIAWHNALLTDEKGNIIGTLSSGEDITERKKSEKALRESEALFKGIFDNAAIGIALIGRDRRPIESNLAFQNMLGYSEEELNNMTFAEFTHPEDIAENFKLYEELMTGSRNSYYMEKRYIRKDSSVIWGRLTVSLIRDEAGNPQSAIGMVEDITDRKKAERFIRDILETVDEGFVVIDPDYKIISANKAYFNMIDSKTPDIIGKYCYELSHHIKKPCSEVGEDCPVRYTFKTGVQHTAIHTHYDENGNPFFVEIKSYPIKDEFGNVISVIEVINNITEKRKLEDQLRYAQKMEAIGQLAGGISHDFNNILTAIIGYSNLLQMKMKKDEPLRAYVESILVSAERAVNLTQSLLAFSRKQVITPQPVNLNEIVKKVERLLLRLIGEDIELKTILTGEDLTVMADAGQIEQVMMNLATNARDAMLKGGRLTIITEKVELDEEFLRIHEYGKKGMYALVLVTDTGTGMDKKTRERIFEPFFTTKETGKGTGLGLAIVYGIIKQHDGYINCYSEIEKGTVFKIYLPLTRSAVIETKLDEKVIPSVGTETILIAEDEMDVGKLTEHVLEEFGYKIIWAKDGEDAVRKFMENKDGVQLLLFDIVMPKMNGKEAYDRIKKIAPDIKVLFMSGYPETFIHKEEIIREGTEIVSKPVSPRDLLKKVREVLDK